MKIQKSFIAISLASLTAVGVFAACAFKIESQRCGIPFTLVTTRVDCANGSALNSSTISSDCFSDFAVGTEAPQKTFNGFPLNCVYTHTMTTYFCDSTNGNNLAGPVVTSWYTTNANCHRDILGPDCPLYASSGTKGSPLLGIVSKR